MKEPYLSTAPCAYELCKRADPVEVIPGHRRKQYHDEACRQAQHRRLSARKTYVALCQLWAAFLPGTQQVLKLLLEEHGEIWTRRVIAAITDERDQAGQPSLSEDEQAALRELWADLQPFTRNILESLLTQRHGQLALLNLITLAIGEERTHAICNSELEQRAAYLEIMLAEYRRIIDLSDEEKIRQQFMAVGQLLDYRALPKYQVGAGLDKWEDYHCWTDERTLAEGVIYARVVLAQESAVKEDTTGKNKLRHAEKQLTNAQAQIQALQEQVEALEAERAAWTAWKEAEIVFSTQLTAMRRYLQEHAEAAIPIVRNGVTLKVVALGNDSLAVTEDHGLVRLSDDELEQGKLWVAQKTGVPVITIRQPIGAKRDKGA